MKVRKKRKPMSPEQRAAAAERLAKAREKRMKENPPTYKNIHPSVLAIPEDQPMSLKNIRKWIKTQKDLLSAERKQVRAGVKGSEARVASHQAYIRNLEKFLRDGDYIDDYYGEHQQTKIKWRCTIPAYDKEGNMKRTHGVYYSDIGTVWSDV
jgi:hypothetical protein